MVTDADLAQRIEGHLERTCVLNSDRRDISKEILKAVEKELLPEIEPHLPPGYSIDLGHSIIMFGSGQLDERLDAFLRLLHDGNPIYGLRPAEQEAISTIHTGTISARETFARRYHLSGVYVTGEPEHI